MEDFISRLQEGQSEVQTKIDKLTEFTLSVAFAKINETQKVLLRIQLTAMQTYNQCLVERLHNLQNG